MITLHALAQGHPVLVNILGVAFVVVLVFILLASMVSIAQFLSALMLRMAGITFRKAMITRFLCVQMSALISALGVISMMSPLLKNNYVFLVCISVGTFMSTALGLVVLLKKWINFGEFRLIGTLFVIDSIILVGIGAALISIGKGYVLFLAVPLVPVGFLFFMANYVVFKD